MTEKQTTVPHQPTKKMLRRMLHVLVREYGLDLTFFSKEDQERLVADVWAEAIYASPNGGRPA